MKTVLVDPKDLWGPRRTEGQIAAATADMLEFVALNIGDPDVAAQFQKIAAEQRDPVLRGDRAAARDRKLVLLRRQHFNHCRSTHAAAIEIRQALMAYLGHGSASPFCQHAAAGTRPLDSSKAALHDLLRLTGGKAPSEKTIRNALATKNATM